MRYFVIASVLIIAGCSPDGKSSEHNIQEGTQKKLTQVNQEAAPQKLTKPQLDRCADVYKAKMNDPSSFSYADSNGGQKVMGMGVEDAVIYKAHIRGKNRFGGLVLNNMMCTFSYNSTTKALTFVSAWD